MLELDAGVFQTASFDVLVRRVRQDLVQRDYVSRDLVHRVGEKRLQRSALARRVLLQPGQDAGELRILLAFGQDLQAEVVVPHVLLVDIEHRQ